jgi:hypothetical protein
MPLRRGRGSAPGERRGGRKKGTPNKRSIPAIQGAIKEKYPDLDRLSLQRHSAAGILAEIEKVRSQKRYDPKVLIDWLVKLARVAEGYAKDDRDKPDFVEVRAELSRLNPEQLLVLKQLALIASGGATSGSPAGDTAAAVRRTIQGAARSDRTGKDPSIFRLARLVRSGGDENVTGPFPEAEGHALATLRSAAWRPRPRF